MLQANKPPEWGVHTSGSERPAMAAIPAVSPPAVPTDDQLVRRCAAGDRDSLDELFRRYRQPAYRVAYRLLGQEADALDAVQEAFVKVLLHLEGFQGRSSFKTWLLRVVSNAALDLGRKRARRGTQPAEPGEAADPDPGVLTDDDPARRMETADLRRALDAALAELPEAQRQTFVLHVDGELSYKEVAETLGISIGTVMSRLFYARQKLKTALSPHVTP
jgi:RNA polymerase sigma-70 factor (ECF subfamily)